MRFLKPTTAAFALALSMLSPVIWCKPPDAKPELIGQVRVDARGLDLQNPADVRVLLTRIEKAAYRACGGNPKLTWVYEVAPRRTIEVYRMCQEDAIKRAVDQVGAVQLAQMYRAAH